MLTTLTGKIATLFTVGILGISLTAGTSIPHRLEAHAQPTHTRLGGNVRYIVSVTGGDEAITTPLTITSNVRLNDMTLETTPVFDCVTGDVYPLVIVCNPATAPAIVVIRGSVALGSPRTVFIDAALDDLSSRDYQFVTDVDTLYLPLINR